MRHASVKDKKLRSPLMEAMTLKPTKRSGKKKLVIALSLTSLVDAFSIMLLYLLTQNTGNGSTAELMNAEKLPAAIKTEALHAGTMIRVDGSQGGQRYFIGDKEVDVQRIASELQILKATKTGDEAEAIIIQADKNVDFSALTPVIRAGSITGFHKFKFAVMQSEGAPSAGSHQ